MQNFITRLLICATLAICTYQSRPPIWGVRTSCDIPNESVKGLCTDPADCVAYQRINDVSSIGNVSRLSFLKQIQCLDEDEEGKVCCPLEDALYSNPWIALNVRPRVHIANFDGDLNSPNGDSSQETDCGQQEPSGLVNQGQITAIDEFPWMALLLYEKAMDPVVPGCGGALISLSFVITAAHCLAGPIIQRKGSLKFVRVGEYNLNSDPDYLIVGKFVDVTDGIIDVKPERTIVHPDYVPGTVSQHHDIGLVQLEHPLEFTAFVRHICLPERGNAKINSRFSVCGWGRTDFFSNGSMVSVPSPIKMKASLPHFDRENCSQIYQPQGLQLINGQICAGGHKARDTCSGDSGSPLMFYDAKKEAWILSGLVSMGPQNCGTNGKPGIYTNVNEYVEWINANADL